MYPVWCLLLAAAACSVTTAGTVDAPQHATPPAPQPTPESLQQRDPGMDSRVVPDPVPHRLALDIQGVPDSQHHGLALMTEGQFIVAGDVWTLAVALDLTGFRDTVDALSANAATMRALARNFSDVARASGNPGDSTKAFADALSGLLDSEVSGIQNDLVTAKKHLRALEMATPTLHLDTLPQAADSATPVLSRERRAWIDVGGAALETVFGVATQRDLGRLQAELAALQVGRRQMSHIADAQASLLNSSFHDQAVMRKQLSRLNQTNELLVTEVVSLQKQTSTLLDQQPGLTILEARMRQAHAALARLQAELGRFLSGWSAAAQHTLSPALLSPEELIYALQRIEAHLTAGRTLLHPAQEDHVGAHYADCRVTTVRIRGGLMLYVDIPVTRDDLQFDLYRAVPLPVATAVPGVFAHIVPDLPFLAVSLDQRLFVHLDEEDRRACRDGTVRLCNPQRPLRYLSEGAPDCLPALYRGDSAAAERACSVALTRHPAPTLYRARGSTTWLFSLPSSEVITAHCSANAASTPMPTRISGIGTLTLPPGCSATLRGAQLTAPAHFTSAFRGRRESPFTMPRLPEASWTNWTLPAVVSATPSLRERVDALINSTTGADPAASRAALRLADLHRKIEDYQREDSEATARLIHIGTTAGTSTLSLLAIGAVTFYCLCCRGQSWPPASQWTPVPTAPFSPEPARCFYQPQPRAQPVILPMMDRLGRPAE